MGRAFAISALLIVVAGTTTGAAGAAAFDDEPVGDARCDLDHDGFGEVLLGQPGFDAGSAADSGSVLVVPGADGGPEIGRAWRVDQSTPGLASLGGSETGDRFGATVICLERAAGADALVVGIPGEDHTSADLGAIAILGPTETTVIDATTVDGLAANDDAMALGAALAAGDLDGDGNDELIAGAPGAAGTGGVIVVDGSETSVLAAPPTTPPGAKFGAAVAVADLDGDARPEIVVGATDDRSGVVVVMEPSGTTRDTWRPTRAGGNGFGAVLATGDLDVDGRDEVAIGSPFADRSGRGDAGEVTIIDPSRPDRRRLLHAGDGLPSELFAENALLGGSLAIADRNGDGTNELFVGVPGADDGAGAVVAVDANGLATVVRQGLDLGGEAEAGDAFGAALGVADVDGSRGAEIVITAPGESVVDVAGIGTAFVLPGGGVDAFATPVHAGLTADVADEQVGSGTAMTAAGTAVAQAVATGAVPIDRQLPPPPPPPPVLGPLVIPTPTVIPVDPRVTGVGDSIMLGATAALRWFDPELTVDAVVGRPTSVGLDSVAAALAAGPPDILIVHLGTNGGMTQAQADQLVAMTADVARVVITTVRVPQAHQDPTNNVIWATAAANDNFVLADWFTLSQGHGDWFWADGVHLTPTGIAAYAQLLADAAGW